jgi:Glycosyltransferase family 87
MYTGELVTPPALARLGKALAAVALAALIACLVNEIDIDLTREIWGQDSLISVHIPVGVDFRNGLYRPAEALVHGGDPYKDVGIWYPPLTMVVALPFQLLDADRAVLAQVGVLVIMNIAALLLALAIAREVFVEPGRRERVLDSVLTFPLFCILGFWLVTSYGFLFSLERGNFDIYALLAALAGLWLLVKRPNQLWLQVVCFSIAAHMKVYPAVLFLLVFWKHRWKSLLPLGVVNAAFLLCLGPYNAKYFLWMVAFAVRTPTPWLGMSNHSAAAFATSVSESLGLTGLAWLPVLVCYLVPIGLWAAATLRLLKRGFSNEGAVWLFLVSIPLMDFIPTTSHDYKLVLLTAPVAILCFHLAREYAGSGGRIHLAQIAVVGALAALIAVSYVRLPDWLGNKYPFVLVLQAVMLWVMFTRPSVGIRQQLPSSQT